MAKKKNTKKKKRKRRADTSLSALELRMTRQAIKNSGKRKLRDYVV